MSIFQFHSHSKSQHPARTVGQRPADTYTYIHIYICLYIIYLYIRRGDRSFTPKVLYTKRHIRYSSAWRERERESERKRTAVRWEKRRKSRGTRSWISVYARWLISLQYCVTSAAFRFHSRLDQAQRPAASAYGPVYIYITQRHNEK